MRFFENFFVCQVCDATALNISSGPGPLFLGNASRTNFYVDQAFFWNQLRR